MGHILTVHILNGDSLRDRFPSSLTGEILVARECLVEGSVNGETLEEFFETRAAFLNKTYDTSRESYFHLTASQFTQIHDLPDDTEVNLWFEDDLFCQVNLWFVCHLLVGKANSVFLVRPTADLLCSPDQLRYGFGGLSEAELIHAYSKRIHLTADDVKQLGTLWRMYQQDNLTGIQRLASALAPRFPFLMAAVEAHLDRFPKQGQLGRPEQSLLHIIQEQGDTDFGTVFKEFVKRESIYGFGDLQVKRMYDRVRGEKK